MAQHLDNTVFLHSCRFLYYPPLDKNETALHCREEGDSSVFCTKKRATQESVRRHKWWRALEKDCTVKIGSTVLARRVTHLGHAHCTRRPCHGASLATRRRPWRGLVITAAALIQRRGRRVPQSSLRHGHPPVSFTLLGEKVQGPLADCPGLSLASATRPRGQLCSSRPYTLICLAASWVLSIG